MRSLTISSRTARASAQPDELHARSDHRIDLTGHARRDRDGQDPVPGRRLRSLGFKPTFKATTSANTSKANGASLETTINQPAGQANIKSVQVPAAEAAALAADDAAESVPRSDVRGEPLPAARQARSSAARGPTRRCCPANCRARPYLVSHGGAAFPDLDLVLEANGVRVILVGNTDIKNGITTTNFATTPDVPVSSVTVNLPIGPHSALAAIRRTSAPAPRDADDDHRPERQADQTEHDDRRPDCPVRIAGQKIVGNTVYLTVQTFAAGRISGSGNNLATVDRHLKKAQKTATLKVPLSSAGRARTARSR